ncbi:hypothetical protein HPB47_008879 [Ixodes persulcatus]|uniref:Uncharacterized protein n=1 Tax=Ixodes persulcatus TaxID=34615 RepID=A0AC60P3S2_IXOPE|nr:hypothetical protein HPB47_008879 [Ixodes persulcatus]
MPTWPTSSGHALRIPSLKSLLRRGGRPRFAAPTRTYRPAWSKGRKRSPGSLADRHHGTTNLNKGEDVQEGMGLRPLAHHHHHDLYSP